MVFGVWGATGLGVTALGMVLDIYLHLAPGLLVHGFWCVGCYWSGGNSTWNGFRYLPASSTGSPGTWCVGVLLVWGCGSLGTLPASSTRSPGTRFMVCGGAAGLGVAALIATLVLPATVALFTLLHHLVTADRRCRC